MEVASLLHRRQLLEVVCLNIECKDFITNIVSIAISVSAFVPQIHAASHNDQLIANLCQLKIICRILVVTGFVERLPFDAASFVGIAVFYNVQTGLPNCKQVVADLNRLLIE